MRAVLLAFAAIAIANAYASAPEVRDENSKPGPRRSPLSTQLGWRANILTLLFPRPRLVGLQRYGATREPPDVFGMGQGSLAVRPIPGREHKLSPAFLQCGSCFALRFSSMAASILFWQHSHPNFIAMEAKRTKPDWIPCPVTRRSSSCHRVTEQRLRHDDTVADCVGTGRSLRLSPPNTSRTKQGCVPRACPNAPELSQIVN